MAYSIVIYSKGKDVCTMLKNRLSVLLPDAYITTPLICKESDSYDLSSSIFVLYDNYCFTRPNNGKSNCHYISLYEDAGNGCIVIDCARIKLIIESLIDAPKKSNSSVSLHLVLSFVHINEREKAVSDILDVTSDSPINIRFDFMSGLRMASSFKTGLDTGSLTDLLKQASALSFKPKDILSYLNPDSLGFVTPGIPSNPDDVFEYGIARCVELGKKLRNLIEDNPYKMTGFIVAEGWRIDEYLKLIEICDAVHVVLPGKDSDEAIGMSSYIDSFKRSLRCGATLEIINQEESHENSKTRVRH